MKCLFALFFSISLIFSQAAFIPLAENPVGPSANTPQCCGHNCSGCKGACCIAKNGSVPRDPAPAVPSHGLSQNDWQLLVPIKVQFLPQLSASLLTVFPKISVGPSFSAPVYQRNCSYLI